MQESDNNVGTLVICNNCKMRLDEDPAMVPSLRIPCPYCGSTSRLFSVDLFVSATGHASISTTHFVEPQTEVQSRVPEALPPFGEFLLYLFLTRTGRVNVIGDLSEDYAEVSKKFGKKVAIRCFYFQVLRSLWPLLRRFLLRGGIVALAAKVLTWILETILKFFSR